MLVETNLGVALEKIRVSEIEDERGGSNCTELRCVGGGDVGSEGEEIFVIDGCHSCI